MLNTRLKPKIPKRRPYTAVSSFYKGTRKPMSAQNLNAQQFRPPTAVVEELRPNTGSREADGSSEEAKFGAVDGSMGPDLSRNGRTEPKEELAPAHLRSTRYPRDQRAGAQVDHQPSQCPKHAQPQCQTKRNPREKHDEAPFYPASEERS